MSTTERGVNGKGGHLFRVNNGKGSYLCQQRKGWLFFRETGKGGYLFRVKTGQGDGSAPVNENGSKGFLFW